MVGQSRQGIRDGRPPLAAPLRGLDAGLLGEDLQRLLEARPLILREEVDRIAALVASKAIIYLFFYTYGE